MRHLRLTSSRFSCKPDSYAESDALEQATVKFMRAEHACDLGSPWQPCEGEAFLLRTWKCSKQQLIKDVNANHIWQYIHIRA